MIETSGRLASLPVRPPGESNRLRILNRDKWNTKGDFIECEVFAEFPNGVPKFNATGRYSVTVLRKPGQRAVIFLPVTPKTVSLNFFAFFGTFVARTS